MTLTFNPRDLPSSPPDHLGEALSGAVVVVKGLPEAERSEPFARAAGSDSHVAGDWAGGPPPESQPSGEEMFLTLQFLDAEERGSAFEMYSGIKTPMAHMLYVKQLRIQRIQVLRDLGWTKAADNTEARLIREMGK